MALTFICTNCNASLTKTKIIKHRCKIIPIPVTTEVESINPENNTIANSISKIQNDSENTVTNCSNENTSDEKCWKDIFFDILDKHETNDDNLKAILDGIKIRKNVPHKEQKFMNFVNAFSISKNVANCAQIIWSIVSSHPNFQSFIENIGKTKKTASRRKLKSEDNTINDSPELKRIKLESEDHNGIITQTPNIAISSKKNFQRQSDWSATVTEKLNKYQTEDNNLKIVIDRLKHRKNFPQKQMKVANLLSTIPQSRKIDNCVKIIWDIINTNDVNNDDKNTLQLQSAVVEKNNDISRNSNSEFMNILTVNDGLNILTGKSALSDENVTEIIPILNQNEWYETSIELLNRHQTDDINLQSIINSLKIRRNIPKKLNKFKNFINTIPNSKKVENCAEKLWNIISPSKIDLSKLQNEIKSVEKINICEEIVNGAMVNDKLANEQQVSMEIENNHKEMEENLDENIINSQKLELSSDIVTSS